MNTARCQRRSLQLPDSFSFFFGVKTPSAEARQRRRCLLLCAQFIAKTEQSPQKSGHFETETRLVSVSKPKIARRIGCFLHVSLVSFLLTGTCGIVHT